MRWAWMAVVLLAAAPASAQDKFDETLDLSLGLQSGWISLDDELEVLSGPARLGEAAPRFVGEGAAWLVPARGGFMLDGARFGLGVAPFWMERIRLAGYPEPLLDARHAGVVVEAYAGYAFGSPREVRPYLEARPWLAVGLLDATSASGDARLRLFTYGLDAQVGVRIPVDSWLFVDAGVNAGLLGPSRAAARIAVGLPIPLANL